MADEVSWHLSGDYFRIAVASIVCPCLVSAATPLLSRPTEGFCNVPLIFHIETGRYGNVALDGLNVMVILHAPGVMAEGDWSVATYIDERADDAQTEALAAIFSGAAGGPMAAFTPLISKNLGVSEDFRSGSGSTARRGRRKSQAFCTCPSIRCQPCR